MTPSCAAADLAGRERVDHGRLFLHFGAGHLVRRQDRDHFLHAFQRFQGLLGTVALLAQGGDHGQLGAHDDVAAQAQLLDRARSRDRFAPALAPSFMTTIMFPIPVGQAP